MANKDQRLITLSVDSIPCGIFDSKKGGGVDSEETKWRSGGMGQERSLGGSRKVDNITLTRLFDRPRDVDLVRWLMSRAGKGTATVSDQYLDSDGNPFGKPFVYTGKLKKVTPGDADSNATGADTYDLEISTEGSIA